MNVDPTLLILLVELLVLETLALLVIGFLFVRRKVQYKNMMEEIIESADASEAARQKVLEQTLKDVFHEGGEEACSKAKQLAEAESRFSKRLISAFVARQHEILNRLDKMTDELISPYRTIISETAEEKLQNERQADERIHTLKLTIDTLKEEKEKINQRLQETEEELERITTEYVSAFKKEELLRKETHHSEVHPAATRQTEMAPGSDTVPTPVEAPTRDMTANVGSIEHAAEEPPAAADQTESKNPGVESHTESRTETRAESGAAEAGHDSGIESDTETDAEISVQDDANSQTAEQVLEEEELLQLREEDAADPVPESEPESAPEPKPGPESEPKSELEQDGDQNDADDAVGGASTNNGDTGNTGAILEDVDIEEAPLMEELVKENAVKSAAGR